MATLELKNLTKKFGSFTAVDSMDLSVADGEMIALLGGSGCGIGGCRRHSGQRKSGHTRPGQRRHYPG